MITVTFSGETLVDVAEQAKSFADETLGVEFVLDVIQQQKVPPPVEKPAKVSKLSKPRAQKAPAEKSSEPALTRLADLGQKIDAGAPDPEADLAKVKEEALDVLRTVFGKGEAGQKKVREILKTYGVKKAGDVPVEKAHDLLSRAQTALEVLKSDAA